MTKANFPSAIALFSSLLISSLVQSIMIERDGGYTDIRVAIHHSIEEDEGLIENIKEIIANASNRLYKALRGQAYFRNVIVIVPKHWKLNNTKHEPTYGDHHFSIADVQVDKQNPLYGEYWTYTVQPGFCGEAGKYIHLTDEYIRLSRENSYFSNSTEIAFVHEWAHLRYGVFDEYGIPGDPFHPAVYDNGTHILPTACIDGIYGYLESIGDSCEFGEQGIGLDSCHYTPDPLLSEVKASLMAYPRNFRVEHFCTDDKKNPELLHNRRAPNEHNRLCNFRSTWDVISKHEDFKSLKDWNRDDKNRKRTPNNTRFTLKRIEDPAARIVLVLDASDSMKLGKKLKYLKESATRFLRDRLPIDSVVAIIACKENSMNLTDGLVKISGISSREKVIDIVNNIDASGKADIGDCLKKGLKMFRYRRTNVAEAGLIVVATGNEENLGNLEYVLRDVIEKKVTVHAIVLDAKVTTKLWDIVERSGGVLSFFPNGNVNESIAPTELDDAFLSAIIAQTNVETQPIVISKQNLWLKPFGSSQSSFLVDGDMGETVKITIVSEHVRNLLISIIDPVNMKKEFDPDSDPLKYNVDETAKRILARVQTEKPGRWTVVVNSSASVEVNLDVEVTSDPMNASDHEPIRLHSWFKAQRIGNSSTMRIYADVKKRYNPVANAKVIASVKTPNNRISEITLKDDGTGADVMKNDGIYSGYFLAVEEAGPHNVIIRVTNPDRKARIRDGPKASYSVPPVTDLKGFKKSSKQTLQVENFSWSRVKLSRRHNVTKRLRSHFSAEAVDLFLQRYQYAGSFQVTQDMVNALKWTPPNRVTDLRVEWTCMSGDTLVVTLSWSPGDGMEARKDSWIELRGSSNWDLLHDNFSGAYLFTDADKLKYPPPPGGLVQMLHVQVPSRLVEHQLQTIQVSLEGEPYISFYFALRVHDHYSNMAEVSNIASARFSPIWNTSFTLEITEIPKLQGAVYWTEWVQPVVASTTPASLPLRERQKAKINVGMFAGFTCLVLFVIVAILIRKKKRGFGGGTGSGFNMY